jgi:protein-disulfide isomerase
MRKRLLIVQVLGIAIVLIAACGAQSSMDSGTAGAPDHTATVEATRASTEAQAMLLATESVPVVAIEVGNAEADWTETVTVEGDYYVLGNPAAPIRMVDFSDFL